MVYTHTHTHTYNMNYYSAIKKEVMLFIATWVCLEIIILNELNQTENDKYITYEKNLKSDTNELMYKTETDSQT